MVLGAVIIPAMSVDELIHAAWKARDSAYAPYSRFAVGAALLGENDTLFTGCNVENISFGLTICAERAAIFAAISARSHRFQHLVIVADTQQPISPCGACRQVMAEFATDMQITSCTLSGDRFNSSLGQLLPRAKVGILDHSCST